MARLTPAEIAANWRACRRYLGRYALGLLLILAASLYVVGYAKGRLAGYLEGRPPSSTPQAQGPPPGQASRK